MCGIAGYIGKKSIDTQRIYNTLGLMKYRGPDHQGWCSFQYNKTNIYLLHSRLGIIDLEERSNQPFTFHGHTLVFNGEIYNYFEVKKDLKKCGHTFITESDTEVLLKAYIEYGEDCVQRFNGMWAFCFIHKGIATQIIRGDVVGYNYPEMKKRGNMFTPEDIMVIERKDCYRFYIRRL